MYAEREIVMNGRSQECCCSGNVMQSNKHNALHAFVSNEDDGDYIICIRLCCFFY